MEKKKKSTEELTKLMKTRNDYNDYYSRNKDSMLTMTVQKALTKEYIKTNPTISQLEKATTISASYLYQIFDGRKKNPNRDKVIMICIALKMKADDIQQLLKVTGYAPLYARNPRDNAILFGIKKGQDVISINHTLLANHHEPMK